MVLVPDMVRYWQHKYQSDQKSLWWGRAKCKQSLLQNWRTCTLRVLVNYYSSITFYRVFFFSEWSVRKNVSISSKNWLIVCFPLCGISLKGAGYNNWSFRDRTVYSGPLGPWKVLSLHYALSLQVLSWLPYPCCTPAVSGWTKVSALE